MPQVMQDGGMIVAVLDNPQLQSNLDNVTLVNRTP